MTSLKKISIIFLLVFLISCILIITQNKIPISDNHTDVEELNTENSKEIIENTKEIIENTYINYWEESTTIEIKTNPENEDFSYYLNDKIPFDIKNLVRANREPLFKATQNLESKLNILFEENYIKEEDIAFKNLYLKEKDRGGEPITDLTIEQASYDIKYFFGLLKYVYGGYSYYGGDEEFKKIENKIIKEIQNEHEEFITSKEIEDLLVINLINVIMDGHFGIGDTVFFETQSKNNFLFCNNLFFDKTESGFFTKINEVSYKLQLINGEDVENKMFPFLNGDSELVWVIGILSNKVEFQQIKITLLNENTGELMDKQIKFINPVIYLKEHSDRGYSLKYIDKIPVLSVYSMDINNYESEEAEEVKVVARTLRDEPVFIIDLRGNRGGMSYFPDIWTREYLQLDTSLTTGGVSAYRETETTNAIFNNINKQPESTWASISSIENEKFPNDNIIFVLVDQLVASAGEDMVQRLRQMENVIFIGTNTSGIALVGNNEVFSLPYSKMPFRFGNNIHLNVDLSTNEGVGFLPDIWTINKESLNRTIKFIEKHKLAE